MQSANESGDVERLLDVLGVPSMSYQSFQKPSTVQPSTPVAVSGNRIEAAFPLLAAALPGLSGAVFPHKLETGQSAPVAEMLPTVPPQDIAPQYQSQPIAAEPAPMQPPSRPSQAVFTPSPPPTSVTSQRPTNLAPPRSTETPIQGVFNILRGSSVRPGAETTNQRGIRNLFHRP
jgi:hypothetical protein